MFKFFKDKLKKAINRFSRDVDHESVIEPVEPEKEEEPIEELPIDADKEAGKSEGIKEEPDVSEPPETVDEEPESREEKKPEPTEQVESEPVDEIEPTETTEEEVPVKEASEEPESDEQRIEVEPAIETEEQAKESEDIKEDKVPQPETKGIFQKIREKVKSAKKDEPTKQPVRQIVKEEPTEERAEKKHKKPIRKESILSKIKDTVTKRSLSEDKFNELFWDLEVVLLENNVAVDVIDKIKDDLKAELVESKIRMGKTQDIIIESLTKSIESLFDVDKVDLFSQLRKKKPYTILFVGVNGVGKTTTIAKVARMLQKKKLKSVMAAADTFRAAAIQQLEEHANKLGIKLIKHDYGSDPAAVAFDAISYARAKDIDVVLVDTAGRQHSNTNLMEEMKKMVRVSEPDLKIFVGESITGNDCIEQARKFDDSVGIDAIILSKADVDEKGGAAVSVSYITRKPIIFIGTGQNYDDLEVFQKELVTKNLGLA